jgi:hypothetical protein
METLTSEALRWALGIGLTPERAAFLAACPKYTKDNHHARHKTFAKDNPDRFLMKSGHKYYYRRKVGGVIHHTMLTSDLAESRLLRDKLEATFRR